MSKEIQSKGNVTLSYNGFSVTVNAETAGLLALGVLIFAISVSLSKTN